jgi:hypothetical protein
LIAAGTFMIWIVAVALAVWVLAQQSRVGRLERRIDALSRALAELTHRRPVVDESPRTAPVATTVPVAEAEATPEPAPVAVAVPLTVSRLMAATAAESRIETPAEPETPTPLRPAAKRREGPNLAAWLSENGLAWLGGGALALGGIFLVTYAAQRGVFTPLLRIWAAVVAGAVMLAASEWIRRAERRAGRPRALTAAVAAGAGAATLYGAIWAAERLYHFIGLETAAPLLGAVSAGLLALAWLHGAPLALLAVVFAYLAPAITGRSAWGQGPLTFYLSLIMVTGYAAAAARRWAVVGLAAGLGAVLWILPGLMGWGGIKAAVLTIGPPVLALAACEWRRRRDGTSDERLSMMLAVALVLASLIAPGFWIALALGTKISPALTVAVSLVLVAVGGLSTVRRQGPALLQIAPYASAVVGLGIVDISSGHMAVAEPMIWGTLILAVSMAASGLAAAFAKPERQARLWAASGAVASALAFGLSDLVLRHAFPAAPWIGPAAGAVGLALCAALLARRTEDPSADLPLALWIWAAAAVALQSLGEAFDPRALPPVFAAAALGGAALQVRLGWRGLASASVAAAIAALGALFGPDLAIAALRGAASPQLIAGVATGAAVLTAAAGLVAGRGPRARRDVGEALVTGAIIIALLGAFLTLRCFVRPHGGGLDLLADAALRTLLLLATGVLARPGRDPGPISRWRPHVFLLAGAAHGLAACGVALNPLWPGRDVIGPPLLDTLALAYLAPALLLALATRPEVSPNRDRAAPYGLLALGAGLAWALLEIRRLCQGPGFDGLDFLGRIEAAADGLVFLALACGALVLSRRARLRRGAEEPGRLQAWITPAAIIALGLADLAYFYLASPWWGPVTRPMASFGEAGLLGACYAAGIGGTFAFWRLTADRPALSRAALVSAVLQAFALLTLAIRLGFRGLDMAPSAIVVARVETWAFSAIWAAYGLAVMVMGVRRGDIALRWTGLGLLLFTTAKVLLFDMARLDGMVRAASFLALGALLIVGALAARRIGAFGKTETDEETPAD